MTQITFGFNVEGIEPHFTELAQGAGAWGDSRSELPLIVGGIDFGETKLSIESRQEIAGDFSCTLRDTAGSLRQLFSRDTRPFTFLRTALTATATTIRVSVVAGLPSAPFDAYIGRETIRVTNVLDIPAGRFLVATRAQYGSTGRAYPNGTRIWLKPPSWRGRSVTVSEFERAAPGAAVTRRQVWVGEIDKMPNAYGLEQWRFNAAGISESIAQRQLYVGFKDIDSEANAAESVRRIAEPTYVTQFDEQFGGHSNASEMGHVLVEREDDTFAVFAIDEVGVVPPSTAQGVVSSGPSLMTGDTGAAPRSFRPVYAFAEPAHIVVLKLLCSNLGDKANGDFDVLPGTNGQFGFNMVRFGADILQSNIDVESFRSVGWLAPQWTGMLSEATTVGDLMLDFCRITRTIWGIDEQGRITVRKFSEYANPANIRRDIVLNDDLILQNTSESIALDEQAITASVTVHSNKDPNGDFLLQTTLTDADIARENPSSQPETLELNLIHLSSRGVLPGRQRLNVITSLDVQQFVVTYRRSMKFRQNGYRVIIVEAPYTARTLERGDVVQIVNNASEDYRGGTMNTSALVISHQLEPDRNAVKLKLLLLQSASVLMPSGRVTSFVPGSLTVGAGEGDHFSPTDCVLWDPANNRFCALVVDAVAGDVLTVGNTPAFTPTTGMFVTAANTPERIGALNEAGYRFPGDGVWLADNDGALANDVSVNVWV